MYVASSTDNTCFGHGAYHKSSSVALLLGGTQIDVQYLGVAEFELIVDMANDNMAAWTLQHKSKDSTRISHIELRLQAPDVDNIHTSAHPQLAEFYEEILESSESDEECCWRKDTRDGGVFEEEIASSSDSTVTSSTAKKVCFSLDNGDALPQAHKFEAIVRKAVRQQLMERKQANHISDLEEVIHKIRDSLLKHLGKAFLDAKPTDAEICYYILQESSACPGMTLLCQHYFTRLAAGGTAVSDGRTESSFKITARDQSSWAIYVPHSSLLFLHERLERRTRDSQALKLPELPRPYAGSIAFVQKKEVYLQSILALPVELLLELKEIRAILEPVVGSPVGYDEVYDGSLCYRLAGRCCS